VKETKQLCYFSI